MAVDNKTSTIRPLKTLGETQTSQTRRIGNIVAGTAELRQSTSELHEEAVALDAAALELELDDRASELAQEDPRDLLASARERYGLTWEELASLVGVSSAALRKWRRGEPVSAQSRHHLAKALAFCELLPRRDPRITDPAQWITQPFVSDTTLTAIDLYGANYASQLLSVARRQMKRTDVLDRFDPNWRVNYAPSSEWSVEIAADGLPAMVRRM